MELLILSAKNFTVNIGAAMTTTIHTAQSGIGSFIEFEGHGLETDDFVQTTGIAVTFTSAPQFKLVMLSMMKDLVLQL